jgi:hypothetical protein
MLMSTRRALIAGFLFLGIPGTSRAQEAPFEHDPASALAQQPTADELIAQGVLLRKSGQDAEALARFQQAYEQRPSPRAVAQIALAEQALGRWVDAERGLMEALGDSADAWVAKNHAYLDESLAFVQQHLGWLKVECNASGATLWIGAELASPLPMDHPLRLEAREWTIEVRAPGFAPLRRSLRVQPGSLDHEVLTLVVQPASIVQSAPVERSSADAAPVERSVPRFTSGRRTAGWIALAGTGGLLLAGSAALVTRESEASIYNGDGCAPSGGKSRYERCGTQRDIGSAAVTIAVVAFVGSGIAAATSAILLSGSPRSGAAPQGQVGCGIAGVGLVCGGTF